MTVSKTVRSILAPALAVTAVLAGCLLEGKDARRGSVVENEVLAGVLYTEAGDPAPGALVRVYPVGHVPQKVLAKASADSGAVFKATTDAEGRYTLDSVPPGEYNILGELDGTFSYLDSVAIGPGTDSLPPDTLGVPGSLTASILLQPNHDPRTVFVQVLGTSTFVNADSAGRFTLRNMAGGRYSIRIVTTLPNYTPLFTELTVREGMEDTLPDRIRLVYTGIPVVGGLRAAYDTARGQVNLAWEPVQYGFFKEYLVFRNDASSLTLPTEPVARVTGTSFQDDLSSLIPSDTGAAPKEFEYRVRVRNKSDEDGLTFGTALVTAAPRRMVVTALDFRYARPDQRAGVGDTVSLPMLWRNPTRDCDSLEWYLDTVSTPARSVRVHGRSGRDSLSIPLPQEPGHYLVQARMRDVSGHWWSNSMAFKVEADPPVADAGGDTMVTIGDSIVLRGRGRVELGKIVSLEWDIGAKGIFKTSASGDTVILASAAPGVQHHVLRVRDDNGDIRLDTMKVSVVDDLPSAKMTWENNPFSKGGGYVFRAQAQDLGRLQYHWDVGGVGSWVSRENIYTLPLSKVVVGKLQVQVKVIDDDGNTATHRTELQTSKWSLVDTVIVAPRHRLTVAAMDQKLFCTGSSTEWRAFSTPSVGGSWSMYDPAKGTWTELSRMIEPTFGPALAASRGRLFAFGGVNKPRAVQYYDSIRMSWASKSPMNADHGGDGSAIELGRKLYLVGGTGRGRRMDAYDPTTDTWMRVADVPVSVIGSGIDGLPAAAVIDSSIHIVNGNSHAAYDPGSDSWSSRAAVPAFLTNASAVTIGGKMYVIGESMTWEYDPIGDSWRQKSPTVIPVNEKTSVAIGNRIYAISEIVWEGNNRKLIRLLTYDPSDDP